MVDKLKKRLISIGMLGQTPEIDFCLSLAAISFGLWIIFLDPFESAPRTFSVFLKLADADTWGRIIALIGIVQLIAVLLENRKIVRLASLAGFLLWVLITGLYWLGNSGSPGIPPVAILALMCALSYIHNGA
jgi:hypothetical protein